MAIYVMLTTLTDEGRKTIKDNPKRIKQVNKEVRSASKFWRSMPC